MRFKIRTVLAIIACLAIAFAIYDFDKLRKDMSIIRSVGQQFDAEVIFLYEDEIPFYQIFRNDVVGVYRVKQPKWLALRSHWLQRKLFTRIDTVFVGEYLMTDDVFDELRKAPGLKVVVLPHYTSAAADRRPSNETIASFLQARPQAVVIADEKVWIGSRSNQERYSKTYRGRQSDQ